MQLEFVENPQVLPPMNLRERLAEFGEDTLLDAELLSVMTRIGFATAQAVIDEFDGNLKTLATVSAKRLEKIKGVGTAKSAQIIAVCEFAKRIARHHADRVNITSPASIADYLMPNMRYLEQEHLKVIVLDTKGNIKANKTIFIGTLNACTFHPREIFKVAVEESANSILLAHNHPSGDPQPSQEDIRATKQVIEAGNIMGIKVLDHLIIGDGIFVSLKEEGFI